MPKIFFMRILVTGATGFLGEHVLAARPPGCRIEILARPTSDLSGLPEGIRVRRGDLSDAASLKKAFEGVDVLLNLASMGFGHAPNLIEAYQSARIPRAVFISTTSIFTTLPAPAKSVRLEAEKLLQESGLAFTLLRPTMIYGTPRDRNLWRLIRFLRLSPVAPLVNGGKSLQQPIHVQDAARAIWQVLGKPVTVGKAYNIAGRRPLSLAEMVETITQRLNRRVKIVPISLRAAIAGAAVARHFPLLPRITREQILRLEEDKNYDIAPARAEFGFEPIDFQQGIEKELNWLSR